MFWGTSQNDVFCPIFRYFRRFDSIWTPQTRFWPPKHVFWLFAIKPLYSIRFWSKPSKTRIWTPKTVFGHPKSMKTFENLDDIWPESSHSTQDYDELKGSTQRVAGRQCLLRHLLASTRNCARKVIDASEKLLTSSLWQSENPPGTHILDALCAARTAVR